jgi:hypothetical protein
MLCKRCQTSSLRAAAADSGPPSLTHFVSAKAGPVMHNEGGPLPVTRSQKRGRKMQGFDARERHLSWKNQGGGGVLVFKGGHCSPPARGRIHPPQPFG